jgi:V/A-type H+-transporting ATPase subunit I
MIRPVPMQRVLLLVPRAELGAVIDGVGALGDLHLLDLPGREEWRSALGRPDTREAGEARRAQLDLLRRIDALLRFFEPPPPAAAPPAAPDALPRAVGAWTEEMDALRESRREAHETIERLERAQRALAAVSPSGVDLARLQALRLLHGACGWLDERELARVEESLAHVPHQCSVLARRGPRRLVVLLGPARERDAIERSLRSAGFEPLALPEGADAEAARGPERLAAQLDEARGRLAALDERFARAREAHAAPLAAARAASERELLRLEAESLAGRSERVAFVSGWVPAARVPALRACVDRTTAGRFHLRAEDPRSIDAVRTGGEEVPILFRNPRALRPVEAIVSAFGRPRFAELDPTLFVAITFWTMFGLMFGDVGQGAVVAAAGFWIRRRMPEQRDLGLLLAQCGISSLAFGFAYGSVFGREDLIPALWFQPMHDVLRLLRVGAGFGLVLLSLGFALGIANAVLRREWSHGVLGPHGLFATSAYWIAAALGLRWLATGELGLEAGRVALLLGAPLGLLFARSFAGELAERRAGSGVVDALLRSALEVLDFVVRAIANTVSFVRLAAFAVSHAGLLVAVFALADVVHASPMGSVGGILVVVLGNVLVIALEGLVVSIQAVRLVYYEFFSKFYEGTGLAYRPLRLAPQGGREGAT